MFPVQVPLVRSRRLDAAILGVHLIALAGVLLPAWPIFWRAALFCLVVLGAAHSLRRPAAFPARLVLYADGGLAFSPAGSPPDAPPLPARRCPGVLALPGLCVFAWQAEMPDGRPGRRQTLAVLADSSTPDAVRHLRIWLRCT
jgi:hypothetical protein